MPKSVTYVLKIMCNPCARKHTVANCVHRDQHMRGYSQEAVVETILRRMPDYVNYICPQFSRTHVNFQRVPRVDTSNPFIAKDIPSADESRKKRPSRYAHGHGGYC
jgi:phosphoribulokinase